MSSTSGISLFLICIVLGLISACAINPNTTGTFRFPILEGDIERGKTSFIALQCHQCHTVNDILLPPYQKDSPLTIELGGKIVHVKTYAELVTSIINPNHVVSKQYLKMLDKEQRKNPRSPMPFIREMKVIELIDLVTFLNSRYVMMEYYDEY